MMNISIELQFSWQNSSVNVSWTTNFNIYIYMSLWCCRIFYKSEFYTNSTDIMAHYFEFLCKPILLKYPDHLGTIFIATPISSSFLVIFIVVIDVSQSLW